MKGMRNLGEVKKRIRKAKTIAIAGHINPDGDSIGSLLSLGLGLRKLGKKVFMVSNDGVPQRYRTLIAANHIAKRLDKKVDLAIAVDCGDKQLLGNSFSIFRKAKQTIAIDHHEFRNSFTDLNLVDPKAASAGELIYILLCKLNISITEDIAQGILTSIIVETNSFRLPNIRALTYNICAKLVKAGIDFYKLSEIVYWSKTKASALLSGVCLSRCKFLKNSKIVWSLVELKDFRKVGAQSEDADAVAGDMLAIKDVEVAVFFREEKPGKLRVGLRSKGNVNVARIASIHGGGGHFDSAGFVMSKNIKKVEQVLKEIKGLFKITKGSR